MTRDARTSGRSALGRFIDRLLGRSRGHGRGSSEGASLFTAHQPPPSSPAADEDVPEPADTAGPTTAPPPEVPPGEPDLFEAHRRRRPPVDAWETEPEPEAVPAAEPEPEPAAEPEPAPEPAPAAAGPGTNSEGGLHTSVHEEALEQVSPRPRDAPGVRVHDDNLEQRSGPVHLTPSQAIELARGGRDTLQRRDRD